MRLPFFFTVAFLVCVLVLASQNPPAVAQDGNTASTIKLASAVEPIRETKASESTPQVETRPSYYAAPAEYISQPEVSPSFQGSVSTTSYAPIAQPAVSRPRMPAEFSPSASARAILSQMPGPVPVQPAPPAQATRRGGKPFESVQSQPTISPYLYLNAGTNNASPMTNYFAFVRPQLDQQEANRQQQREIQQLRAQMQKMSSTGGGLQQSANPNVAAHFMDTAQFYRRWQR
jgi:hypothetical protein